MPAWPPDVFGLMAALVQRAGLYGYVLTRWPAKPDYAGSCWELSKDWRAAIESDRLPPRRIREQWAKILDLWDTSFSDIANQRAGLHAIMTLLAVSDECGCGLGGVYPEGGYDEYEEQAAGLLGEDHQGSTRCREIHPSRLRVLPKRRTPPSGLNVRSLSLHLACTFGCEVKPQWAMLRSFDSPVETVNVLVLPYPFVVDPLSFQPAEPQAKEMANMDPRRFGFFTVARQPDPDGVALLLKDAFAAGRKRSGKIHIVLFPEASLLPEEYSRAKAIAEQEGAILMAGVGEAAVSGRKPGRNTVHIADPTYVERVQEKHHRWRLDRPQILRYEMGATLNPARDWWEYIAIHERKQHFLQIASWLLIAPLICEDLARPDPVGEFVRSVGPDLVIAFLMDGPQLPARWPARYATALADDPGCSVLTITSLGMALRSQSPSGRPPSRVIASWKDPVNGLREIELPSCNNGAVVLTLNQDTGRGDGNRQFSADGRVDRLGAGVSILSRVQYLNLDE